MVTGNCCADFGKRIEEPHDPRKREDELTALAVSSLEGGLDDAAAGHQSGRAEAHEQQRRRFGSGRLRDPELADRKT